MEKRKTENEEYRKLLQISDDLGKIKGIIYQCWEEEHKIRIEFESVIKELLERIQVLDRSEVEQAQRTGFSGS